MDSDKILEKIRMSGLIGYRLYDKITGRVRINKNPNPTIVTPLATKRDMQKMPKVMLVNNSERTGDKTYLIVNDTSDSTMFFDGTSWGGYIEHRFTSYDDVMAALDKALADKRLVHRFTKVLSEMRIVDKSVHYSEVVKTPPKDSNTIPEDQYSNYERHSPIDFCRR